MLRPIAVDDSRPVREPPPDPSLSDYLAVAALENPGLKAAFHRWQADVERTHFAGRLPDPRFSYTYYMEEVETRVGPRRQSFALSQMLPWFGKLSLREKESTYAAQAAYAGFEAERLALFRRVAEAYRDYWYLGRSVESVRVDLELVKRLESVIRVAYEAGEAGYSDLIRVQVEIGRLEDRLETLLDGRRPAMARLNAAMNRPPQAELPWPSDEPPAATEISARPVHALAGDRNPELEALRRALEKEQASVELAERNFYPDLTAGVTCIDTGGAVMPGVSDSGKDPVLAMLSINVPLDRAKYRANEAAARRRHRAAAAITRTGRTGKRGHAKRAMKT